MRKLLKWLLAVVVLFDSLRRKPRESRPHADTRLVEPAEPHPRAELVVAGLLLATGAAGALAVLAYGLDWSTQAFGGALTGALMLLAAAFIVAAKTFVPDEHVDEEYPPEAHPEEQGDVTRIVRQSASGITRKRLLGCAAALAGGGLGAALVVPAVSLGPVFDTSRLNASPWRRGIGLLDDKSRPWLADDIHDATWAPPD